MENWKPVVGFQGLYEISDLGRLRRVGKAAGATVGHILKPKHLKSGYVQYGLSNKPGHAGKVKYIKGHKLVLEAFVCPRPSGLQSNHKNGDPGDNRLENLEWVTMSQNMRHAFDELGRQPVFGERNGQSKLTANNVRKIRELAATGQYTHRQIALHFDVKRVQITRIINRKRWAHI